MRRLAALPLAGLFLLPLLLSLALVLPGLTDAAAVRALLVHPQFSGALGLTLLTGLASTALSLICALVIIFASGGAGLARRAGLFLALPHLSMAIGLAFLIMPAGLLARLVAVFAGLMAPPQWLTTQDPWGVSLTAALVLKETPFLVWAFASLLNRDDLRAALQGQAAAARSLGHGPASTFLRITLPQLLPQVKGPLIAVLAYGLSVVDMALVIGPTQPPTLAQLLWTDINDADPATAARGAAGVLLLTVLAGVVIAAAAGMVHLVQPLWRRFCAGAPRVGAVRPQHAAWLWSAWSALHVVLVLVMILQSLAARWPFPLFLPEAWTLKAWLQIAGDARPLLTSFALAVATAAAAVLACVAWFETQPQKADVIPAIPAILTLCLPSLLWALGQYRLFLALGITGTWAALFFAHALPVFAYAFLFLRGPYRAFDPRWQQAAAGLKAGRWRTLFQVKLPLLKAPLLATAAVGFAVSVAQFVPAQLAAAGRHATLPMEAVTLSAGGNRPLIAAYGLALMALPLMAFTLAGLLGRPRWRPS